MDNEKTILDNAAQPHVANNQRPVVPGQRPNATQENKQNTAQVVAIAGVSAVLLGGTAAMLMSATKPEEEIDDFDLDKKDLIVPEPVEEEPKAPYLMDNDLEVSTSVNDSMSFNTAFATARAELGPGGVFEWRGNVYATYTKEEWNSMSAAEKADFQDNFTWNHGITADMGDRQTAQVQHTHSTVHEYSTVHEHATVHSQGTTTYSEEHHYHNDGAAGGDGEMIIEDVVVERVDAADTDIQVLGVEHDDVNDINTGIVSIDDNQVAFIDVDNDLEFDVLAVDENNNGAYDNNEMADISSEHITVDDLGGFTDGYGMGDDIDYTNDANFDM